MITVVTTVSDSNTHRTYGKSNFVIVEDGYTNEELGFFTQMIFHSVSNAINKYNEVNK